MHSLAPIVLVLLAAVLSVTLCRSLRVPPMLGYLVVGFLAGPGVASLIPEGEKTQFLGEIGIVFMMFSIGLEFSLPKLRAMRHLVFGLGLAQVVVTLLLIALVMGWLAGEQFFGLGTDYNFSLMIGAFCLVLNLILWLINRFLFTFKLAKAVYSTFYFLGHFLIVRAITLM